MDEKSIKLRKPELDMPTYLPDTSAETLVDKPVAVDDTAPSYIDIIKMDDIDKGPPLESEDTKTVGIVVDIDQLDTSGKVPEESKSVVEETPVSSATFDLEVSAPEGTKEEDVIPTETEVTPDIVETTETPEKTEQKEETAVPEMTDVPLQPESDMAEDEISEDSSPEVEVIDIHEELVKGSSVADVISSADGLKEKRIPVLIKVKSEDQQYFIEYPLEQEITRSEETLIKEVETIIIPEGPVEEGTTEIETTVTKEDKADVESTVEIEVGEIERTERFLIETGEMSKDQTDESFALHHEVQKDLPLSDTEQQHEDIYIETIEIEKVPERTEVDIEFTKQKEVTTTTVEMLVEERTKTELTEIEDEPLSLKESERTVSRETLDIALKPEFPTVEIDIDVPQTEMEYSVRTKETVLTENITTSEVEVVEDVDVVISEKESHLEKVSTFDKVDAPTEETDEEKPLVLEVEIVDTKTTVTEIDELELKETTAEFVGELEDEVEISERESIKLKETLTSKLDIPDENLPQKDIHTQYVSLIEETVDTSEHVSEIEQESVEAVTKIDILERKLSLSGTFISTEKMTETVPVDEKVLEIEKLDAEFHLPDEKPKDEILDVTIKKQTESLETSDVLEDEEVVETTYSETIEIEAEIDSKVSVEKKPDSETFIETIEIDERPKTFEETEVHIKPSFEIQSHFSETITIEEDQQPVTIVESVIDVHEVKPEVATSELQQIKTTETTVLLEKEKPEEEIPKIVMDKPEKLEVQSDKQIVVTAEIEDTKGEEVVVVEKEKLVETALETEEISRELEIPGVGESKPADVSAQFDEVTLETVPVEIQDLKPKDTTQTVEVKPDELKLTREQVKPVKSDEIEESKPEIEIGEIEELKPEEITPVDEEDKPTGAPVHTEEIKPLEVIQDVQELKQEEFIIELGEKKPDELGEKKPEDVIITIKEEKPSEVTSKFEIVKPEETISLAGVKQEVSVETETHKPAEAREMIEEAKTSVVKPELAQNLDEVYEMKETLPGVISDITEVKIEIDKPQVKPQVISEVSLEQQETPAEVTGTGYVRAAKLPSFDFRVSLA